MTVRLKVNLRKGLGDVACRARPNRRRQRFEKAEKSHHHDDGIDLGFTVERSNQYPFGDPAQGHPHQNRDDHAPPVSDASIDLGHADVGGDHRHGALGKVQDVGGLPNDDEAQGDE